MNKNLLKLNFLALGLCLATNVSAQDFCGADHANEVFFNNNPQQREIYNNMNRRISEDIRAGRLISQRNSSQIIEIPIILHVFTDGSPLGSATNPTDETLQSMLDYTNDLYKNEVFNEANGVVVPFKFVLAKRKPDNTSFNGIIRYDYSGNSAYTTYGLDYDQTGNGLTEEQLRDARPFKNQTEYYNVYLVNKIGTGGVGGYANFAVGHGFDSDRTVMRTQYAKAGEMVFAHEFGHALGLHHVFEGNQDTTCNVNQSSDPLTTGDLVADTSPTINGNNYYRQYGTSNGPQLLSTTNHCTNQLFDDVIYNVMNYGYTAERMFTQGQLDRALGMFEAYRTSFLTSLATTAPSTTSNIPIATTCIPERITGVANLAENRGYGHGMTLVQIGSINNRTNTHYGPNPVFYHDYTTKNNINTGYVTEIEEGSELPVTLGIKNPQYNRFYIYIDYNNDGDFDDIGENVVENLDLTGIDYNTEKTISTQISIPTSGVVKNIPLRMRVIGDARYGATFGACDDRYRGEVEDYTVIVKEATSTVWNGTSWSAGLPTPTKEGIVRGDLVLNEYVNTNKFTLESGSVTLNSTMLVNEVINNLTADKFVINSAGLYQQNPTDKAIGEFTVIQNSSPMILNDATLWSSPVKNQNVRSFSPQTLLKRFYKYDEANNKFSSLFVNDPLYPNPILSDPFTYNFEPAIGYHIRVSANQNSTVASPFVGKFVGELNTGIITVPTTVNSFGYNLVGNPYPSVIIADSFLQTNPNVESLYFWTQEAPLTSEGYANNNYASYTLAGGVEAAAGGVAPNKNISKGQGFFVEMAVPTNITFNNYMRSISAGGVIMHRTEEDLTKRVKLDLFEGTQAKNQILISYMDNATNAFDQQIDGKLNRMYTGSSLYSLIENNENKFVIQGRDAANFENDVVKLGFEAKAAAVYTIKIADLENLDNQNIYLIDNLDNQIVDLTVSDYNFNSEIGTFNERFEILYVARNLGTIDSTISKDNVKAIKVSNGIKIVSSQEIKNIEVYDVLGRKVSSTNPTGKSEVMLTNISKSNQVIIIKVTSVDGTTSNVKVVY